MINHKSYRTFRDVARSCSTSLAAGVDAENKRQQIERERAVATRERNKVYWARMRQDQTPGDRQIERSE